MVWQDMAGLTAGRLPRFVKRYADVRGTLLDAARRYVTDVAAGTTPTRRTATPKPGRWSPPEASIPTGLF